MKEIKEKNSFLLTITDYETLMNQITKKRSLRLSAEMRIFEKIMENKENREKIILILKRLLLFILIFTTFNLILFCCLLLDLSIYSSIFIIGLFELSILFCYLIKSYKKLFTDKKKILFSLEILALLISTVK